MRPYATWRRHDVLLLVALGLVAAVLFGRGATVGGFRWTDGSVHAMDAVLILDWLSAGPEAWSSPKDFALQQYAHYPALGLVGVYPPGFAITGAGFFAMTGVSVAAVRLLVVIFGVCAAAGCFVFVRRWASTGAAGWATLLLITTPIVVHWSRQAMLETPTLAVLMWLLVCLDVYVARPRWWSLVLVVGLTIAAPLFKQNAIIIVPVVGLVVTHLWWRRRIPSTHFVPASLLVVVMLGGYFGAAVFGLGSGTHASRALAEDGGTGAWLTPDSLTYYLGTMPAQGGITLLLAAVGGGLLSVRQWNWRWALLTLWFVAAVAFVALLSEQCARYFFFGYAPLAIAGGAAFAWIGRRVAAHSRVTASVVSAVLLGVLVYNGYRVHTPYRPDFTALVQTYADEMRGNVVLFEGHRDTDFVFATRAGLGPQQCVVLRGSKTLYSCASWIGWELTGHVDSVDDVRTVLDYYQCGLIFVQRGNPHQLREVELLERELADATRYEHVGVHTLDVVHPYPAHPVQIDVYRPRGPIVRRAREVEIPMPLIGKTIRVELAHIGS